jgi:hypothetical protein
MNTEALDTRPITPNQIGRIMSEFEKRGWNRTYGPYDRSQLSIVWNERYKTEREARLDICSRIIGRRIKTTRQLRRGEAGMIIKVLTDCPTDDDLIERLEIP